MKHSGGQADGMNSVKHSGVSKRWNSMKHSGGQGDGTV